MKFAICVDVDVRLDFASAAQLCMRPNEAAVPRSNQSVDSGPHRTFRLNPSEVSLQIFRFVGTSTAPLEDWCVGATHCCLTASLGAELNFGRARGTSCLIDVWGDEGVLVGAAMVAPDTDVPAQKLLRIGNRFGSRHRFKFAPVLVGNGVRPPLQFPLSTDRAVQTAATTRWLP